MRHRRITSQLLVLAIGLLGCGAALQAHLALDHDHRLTAHAGEEGHGQEHPGAPDKQSDCPTCHLIAGFVATAFTPDSGIAFDAPPTIAVSLKSAAVSLSDIARQAAPRAPPIA